MAVDLLRLLAHALLLGHALLALLPDLLRAHACTLLLTCPRRSMGTVRPLPAPHVATIIY
jgi:hypothetical protein